MLQGYSQWSIEIQVYIGRLFRYRKANAKHINYFHWSESDNNIIQIRWQLFEDFKTGLFIFQLFLPAASLALEGV